ncbi:Phospho-N-acetylmuramoyl-pentapeptide-transferase [Acetitomaculum ruminis DSM 5522]|uniref:Phospho-N-acetylmuramoyl-pentapeptide-transferase n=1 Tax=Acetitomaculum ruminis DSM 5522 TaxID=1120918 RepID=A0A1I0VWA1_9FIRM|nr:phospho-N-acetylmuramoyl-pentapeptide-transferase [Acetitomaculum ruminis]SFA80173.1 Phospho-N-acetylmuramoyl-pentapeptide-transferase [Acetitomaculum ruminis DSM 5522]
MEKTVILPLIAAFIITVIQGPFMIPFLIRLKVGQTEREELKSHLKKAGTPTMGGIMMLVSILIVSLFFAKDFQRILPVLVLTIGFGIIGFLDDYLKVVLRRSDGLIAWQKLLLQFIITAIFCYVMIKKQGMSLDMIIPFVPADSIAISPYIAIPLLFFVVLGTVNGTNFTDGVDGLATSVTIVTAGFFLIASKVMSGGIEPIAAAVMGALLGFLVFNAYPAKVFMGDTGSLALGGFIAGSAYMLKMPLFIPIIGFIYLVEVVSVIMQVGYFKATHGKRIFKMAPIHHHFELSGWSETRVVAIFTIVTFLLCLLSLYKIVL